MALYCRRGTMLPSCWQSTLAALFSRKRAMTRRICSVSARTNSTTTRTLSSISWSRWTTTQPRSSSWTASLTAHMASWTNRMYLRRMTWGASRLSACRFRSFEKLSARKLLNAVPVEPSKDLSQQRAHRPRAKEQSLWLGPLGLKSLLRLTTWATAALRKNHLRILRKRRSLKRFTKKTNNRTTGWTRTGCLESMASQVWKPALQRQQVHVWQVALKKTGTSSSWWSCRARRWMHAGRRRSCSLTGQCNGGSCCRP